MNETTRIESEESLRKFIYDVDGLHDCLLHECILLHPGYVNEQSEMWGDAELLNAWLLFQSQFPDIGAIELILRRVSRFRFEPRKEFRLEGEIQKSEIVLYPSGKGFAADSEIRSAQAEYRILGKGFLGQQWRWMQRDGGDLLRSARIDEPTSE